VRSGLFFTFVWPVVVAVLFGFVFAGQSQSTPRALRVVVVDEDNTDASRAFVAKLESSGDFTVDRASRPDAEDMVRRAQRSAFIAIKPGFGEGSERMFYGEPRAIEIGNDPARQAEASTIEGLLIKHAMSDFQTLFTDAGASRKMVDNALKELGNAGNASPVAPLRRFLGELDTFLASPTTPGGPGTTDWQPVKVTRSAVARERRGPANGFDVTFQQGVIWGIIGCIMSFAIGLVSERVHGTFVRLQMAPLTRAQILAGKALACFASIAFCR
jgi:ABC-2 type transport system permease protein